jgi:hypothetical protein
MDTNGTATEVINPASDTLLQMRTALAAELKLDLDKRKIEMERVQAEFTTLQLEIINILESMNIDSVKTHGFNFFIEEKASVKTPKTLEEKRMLFDYLTSQGMFDEMVSVNSMTLNSYYKAMAQQAAEQGILDFKMPGIEEPSMYKTLKMRRA